MNATRLKALLLPALLMAVVGCTYAPRYDDDYPYDYYYYPQVGVYFHLFSGDYHYRHDKHWVRAKVLPSRFYLDYRDRRPVRIRDATPYRYHEQHREQFRAPPKYRHDDAHNQKERRHNRETYERYHRR